MAKHSSKILMKWKRMGRHFGFPKCCINDFCNEITLRSQRKAGNCSGFIPCKRHSKLVLLGKITLKSLIRDRYEIRPFRM